MGLFVKRPRTYEGYQYSGDEENPGWPEGWIDQLPTFQVETEVPENFVSPELTAPGGAVIVGGGGEEIAAPLPPLPRFFDSGEPGRQVFTIAGACLLHEAQPGDWIMRHPDSGEYFTISGSSFRTIFQDAAP